MSRELRHYPDDIVSMLIRLGIAEGYEMGRLGIFEDDDLNHTKFNEYKRERCEALMKAARGTGV